MEECRRPWKDWLLMLVNTIRRSLCSVHSAINEGISCVHILIPISWMRKQKL